MRRLPLLGLMALFAILTAMPASASEADLVLPDLAQPSDVPRHDRAQPAAAAAWSSASLGLLFGLVMYTQLKNLPVHRSMREISELIYETCKTYLVTQGKFILLLEALHRRRSWSSTSAALRALRRRARSSIILLFSLVGIAGSYGVAWFGIRVNTFANSRTAFASLRGKPFPTYAIPLKAGMSHRHAADLVELVMMLVHPALRARATTPAPASSASPSASRSAPRRCASPAASSPRSPTSAPT